MTRAHLPNRRPASSFEVEHEGRRFRVALGLYEDLKPGEVFISALGKTGKGSMTEALARDAAILASLALQFGVPTDLMRRAITRDDHEKPATLIGAVLDAMGEGTWPST